VSAVEITGRLLGPQLDAVLDLVRAATDADAVRPLSEHVMLHLRHGGEGSDLHLLVRDAGSGEVAGYGHLDPTDLVAGSSAEVVVHPAYRRRGYGRRLVEAAQAASPDGRLRLWAHGDHAAARALAAALGYQEIRQLWQLRRSLSAPLPAARVPAGTVLRPFRPGADDATWLALNARAFATHPEQGGWTEQDLRARMKEPWFSPEGFLVAEHDGRMVGYHWTKVHGEDPAEGGHGHGHGPIGEVYVVGVDPDLRGHGLGRALTLAGLHRLQDQGLQQAMLYVESDNAPALAVYQGLGFTHWDTDVMFRRGPSDVAAASAG
jgi:mycothiol synthase